MNIVVRAIITNRKIGLDRPIVASLDVAPDASPYLPLLAQVSTIIVPTISKWVTVNYDGRVLQQEPLHI